MMSKLAAITGSSGFIASNLIKELSKRDYDIIGIDINEPNTKFLGDLDTDVRLMKADCRKLEEIDSMIELADVCYHLAAQTSVPASIEDPLDTFEHNVIGSANVIHSCMKHGVKVIFTSSFSVYGNIALPPIPETAELRPISPYGMSKMIIEQLMTYYRKHHRLDGTILRLSNVYGPMDFKSVVYHFLSKSLDNSVITVNGTGKQTRDFLYVGDAVDALIESSKAPNGIYNIGTGIGTSVNEVVSILKKIGSTPTIEFGKELKGDIKDSWADISLAKKSMDWEPRYSVEDGTRIFNSWVRDKE